MFSNKTLTKADIKLLKEIYKEDYETYIEKVKNGYPVQYLIGNVPFLNTNILVNENVLIPRFETEYLVEKILNKVKHYQNEFLKLIDIGTGSGCIAISMAKNTNFKCIGIDNSEVALEVAIKNNLENKTNVTFMKKDILKEDLDIYDIYISNPPYIDYNEIVDPSTKYEPQNALYARDNGLIFYKTILEKIKNQPKLIAFEIGETQGEDIKKIAKDKFPKAIITIEKDLCQKDRYIFIEF